MAFGDLNWSGGGSGTSIPGGGLMVASMSHSVSVGDLICVSIVEADANTTTSIYDDLGQTYTHQDTGNLIGTGHQTYWFIATTSGTITTITAQGTASSNDWALCAACFAGPFTASPLDVTPGTVNDFSSTSWTAPATGTLAQADELIISSVVLANTGSTSVTGTSPNTATTTFLSTSGGGGVSSTIGYEVVSSTSSVAPDFTSNSGIWADLSTMSFKKSSSSNTTISPGQGNLVFSEVAPNISQIIEPGQGNLSFSKFVSNVVVDILNTSISPSRVDLSFSEFVPDVTINLLDPIISPSRRDLSFSTFALNLEFSHYVIIPSGNLRFTKSSFVNNFVGGGTGGNLRFSLSPPVVELFVNEFLPDIFTPSKTLVVAVEVDLYDGDASEIKTLRVWSGSDGGGKGLTRIVNNDLVAFDPRLYIPVQIGSAINADQYGEPLRVTAQGGIIEFANGNEIWDWLSYHWKGRTFRLYKGNSDDDFELFRLVYTGRVDDLNFDEMKVSIKTIDFSIDFDVPLVSTVYPDVFNDSIKGTPTPYLRGEVYSVEPVLEDEATQSYRLSYLKPLVEIMEIRLGGVVWNEYVGSGSPNAGEWKGDLANGTFTLGSPTLGQEVRCDARTEMYSSMDLIREIINDFGGTIDETVAKNFEKLVSGPIGFYTKTPINVIDVLDMICFPAGGSWEFAMDEKVKIRILEEPDESLTYRHSPLVELTEINVNSLALIELIPPAWRLKVEYKRNWYPLTNILPAVSDEDKARFTATGIVAEVFADSSIRTLEPKAIDVPLIRSLFVNESDAIDVRDRLSDAWGIERRLYDVTCWLDRTPELYDTVYVNFQMVRGYFRIISVLRSIGGGLTTLRLWGGGNIVASTIRVLGPDTGIGHFNVNSTDLIITTYPPDLEVGIFDPYIVPDSDDLLFTTYALNIRNAAPPSVVDSRTGLAANSGGSWTVSSNSGVNITSGMYCLIANHSSTGNHITGVTGDGCGTFTQLVTLTNGIELWGAPVVSGASHPGITATMSDTTGTSAPAYGWFVVGDNTAPFDSSVALPLTTAGSGGCTGTWDISDTPDLLLFFVGGQDWMTEPGGWTDLGHTYGIGGNPCIQISCLSVSDASTVVASSGHVSAISAQGGICVALR